MTEIAKKAFITAAQLKKIFVSPNKLPLLTEPAVFLAGVNGCLQMLDEGKLTEDNLCVLIKRISENVGQIIKVSKTPDATVRMLTERKLLTVEAAQNAIECFNSPETRAVLIIYINQNRPKDENGTDKFLINDIL